MSPRRAHPCGSCSRAVVAEFACGRCDSTSAFGLHDGAHRAPELRCRSCNALPPSLRTGAPTR